MRMFRDSVITYATLVVRLIASALATIVITRVIGLEGKGEVSLLLSVMSFLPLLGMLGTAHATIYHLGKQTINLDQLLGATWSLALLETVFSFGFGVAIWFLGSDTILRGLDWRSLLFVVSFLPAEILLSYSTYLFRGLERPDLFNFFRLFRSLTYLVGLLAVWMLDAFSIRSVLMVWAIALAISALLAQIKLWLMRPSRSRVRFFQWAPINQLLKYGLQIYPTLLLAFLGYRLDIYIINSLLTQTDVGAYSIAVSVAEIVWFIPNAMGIVLYPVVSHLSTDEANELTPLALRQVMLLTTFAVLGLLVIGRPLMVFAFGADAAGPAIPVLYLLLPGVLGFSMLKTLWQDLCGRGRPLVAGVTMLTVVGVDVGLNLMITPRIGINGAAISASAAYLTGTVFILWFYRHLTGVGIRRMLTPTHRDRELYRQLLMRFLDRLPQITAR